jgi:UDP-2,3-diacylglucosamine pyrophosphatase LpxH
LHRIDRRRNHAAKCVDSFHKWLARHFSKRARKYALRRCADVIICGHTHRPEHIVFPDKKRGQVEYLNCGCWLGQTCSFVTVDEQGVARLHSINL